MRLQKPQSKSNGTCSMTEIAALTAFARNDVLTARDCRARNDVLTFPSLRGMKCRSNLLHEKMKPKKTEAIYGAF